MQSEGLRTPVIEVHISNTKSRRNLGKKSFISPHAEGIIQVWIAQLRFSNIKFNKN